MAWGQKNEVSKPELSDFDFSSLWEEPEQGGLLQWVPIINMILLLFLLILKIFGK